MYLKTKFILFFILFIPFFANSKNSTPQLTTQLTFNNTTGIFTKGNALNLNFQIKNNQNLSFSGQVIFTVYTANLAKEKLHTTTQNITLKNYESRNISIKYLPKQAGFYWVQCVLKNASGWIAVQELVAGYDAENVFSPISRKVDFEQFWQNTRKELDKITPNFKIIPKEELWTADYKIFLVEMQSLDNITIKGWYRIPKNNWDAPVVLQLPALGNTAVQCPTLTQNALKGVPKEYAVFCLDIRGHGLSREQLNLKVNQYFTWNLAEKEQYFYRGAVADAMRAVDFLVSKPELNPKQIIVEGASQGGGLALLLAGLDKRIAVCAVDSPFLCDFENYFKTVKWPWSEVKILIDKGILTEWRAYYHLSYFDAKNFASYLQIPLLLSVGLQDLTCPPITAFAMYNKVTSPKKYYVYPYAAHEGGEATHRKIKFDWIAQQLKL